MSIKFIITPYDPNFWETTSSDLQINMEEFKTNFLSKWKDATIRNTPKGGLLWSIPEAGSAGFYGEVQSNKQVATFGPGNWTLYKDFVLWYRKQIPQKYELHLFTSSSMESLVISSNTTQDDIEQFF